MWPRDLHGIIFFFAPATSDATDRLDSDEQFRTKEGLFTEQARGPSVHS